MADQLKGKRVAALATHGFEQDELLKPRKALEDAGAKVDVVSLESGKIRGWKHKEWDLINAGARWVDKEVVVDRGIVSSRKPDDIPAFNRKMIEEFAEGIHGGAGRRAMAGTRA